MSKTKRKPPSRDGRDPFRDYPSWKDREKEFEAKPWRVSLRWLLGAFALVVILVGAIGLVTTGSVFWHGESAKLTNPSREKAIVFDANRTLSTYEGFYDTCNSYNAAILQAADATEEAASREKTYDAKTDPFGTERKSISAVRENARGLRNRARDLAASYNADSSANTRAPFRAADLPYTLDPNGAQQASCGAGKEPGR